MVSWDVYLHTYKHKVPLTFGNAYILANYTTSTNNMYNIVYKTQCLILPYLDVLIMTFHI